MILKELNGLPRYFALLRGFHGDVHINCLLALGSLSPSLGLQIPKEWMGSRFYIPYSYLGFLYCKITPDPSHTTHYDVEP